MVLTMATLVLFAICDIFTYSTGTILHESFPPIPLSTMTSYSSLTVLRWRVPVETKLASWNILATTAPSCQAVNVTIWLKPASLPVISPDGGQFPPQMLPVLDDQIFHNFLSTGPSTHHKLTVSGPRPGYWLMAAAGSPTQGQEERTCYTLLSGRAEYTIERDIITLIPTIHNYQDIKTFYTITNQQTYKFVVPGAWTAQVDFTKCSLRGNDPTVKRRTDNCPVRITESPHGIPPLDGDKSRASSLDCSSLPSSGCSLLLDTQDGSTHYITVTTTANSSVQLAVSVKLGAGCHLPPTSGGALFVNSINTSLLCGEESIRPAKMFVHLSSDQDSLAGCEDQVQLGRRMDRDGGVMFVRTGNVSTKTPLKLKPEEPKMIYFNIEESDTGGTLAVDLAILRQQVGSSQEIWQVTGCLSQGYRSFPSLNKSSASYQEYYCPRGRKISQSSQHFSGSPVFDQVLVPYPPPGKWYLVLVAHCSVNGRDCPIVDVPVLFSIHSNCCISGVCGRYGQCFRYMSGGIMFSACSCIAGHTGPACNDPTQAEADYQVLMATLLLTTTNLAMLPALMLAAYRAHYAESVVYASHIIFSSLYHACAGHIYSLCILNATILRFSDIFTNILATWVTLLAIAPLPPSVRSVLHVLGATGIAMAVEVNMDSLYPFLIPSMLGVAILLLSLAYSCIHHRKCCPDTKYFLLQFLPGLAIGGAGLVSTTLLPSSPPDTAFTHAAWHVARGVVMGLWLPKARVVEGEADTQHALDSSQSSVGDMAGVVRGLEDRGDMHQL